MWFIFGLITLISFCVYYIYKAVNASWEGTHKEVAGIGYQYKLHWKKDEITQVLLGIECPSGFDFSLKREGSFDRFFKKLGISKEHEVGNKEFDDLVYVVSDQSALHEQISENKKLIDDILVLFNSRSTFDVNIGEVRCHSGRMWFSYEPGLGFNENKIPELAAKLVPVLQSVSNELQRASLPQGKKWRDPFVFKAAIILAISSGMLINGIAQTFRLQFLDLPFTLDTKPLVIDAVIWAVGLIVVLIALTLFLLGRSSRTHLVLVELVLAGTLGCALTALAQLRDLNMEMDPSHGAEYVVNIHEKDKVRHRRSTSYYLYVDDWTQEEDIRKIEVSGGFYDEVYIGNDLKVMEKPGYLGYRWVSDLKKL